MLDRLRTFVSEHDQDEDIEFIKACHQAIMELYPGLNLRWVHIYGKRWAHLYGNSGEPGSHSPLKIKLNENYGICIDNSELIPPQDLVQITAIISEGLAVKC